MLYDKNLIDTSLRFNRSDQYYKQYENYPVLEGDVEQEMTYD